MKVLIISQFAGSPDLGMVTRNYNWAFELQRRGCKVSIVAGSYSHYRNKHPKMDDKKIKTQIIDGIKYMWIKTPHYKGESHIGRISAMVSFNWRLKVILKKLKAQNFDIVVASSPQPFVVYPAHKFAKKCGAKLIYDIRDLWPLTLRKLADMSKWHPFIMALQHAENYACNHADLVTCVPQNAKHYLVKKGMPPENFLFIGNGYLAKENVGILSSEIKQKLTHLKKAGVFLIGYCGTLGKANGMHAAIESIAKTKNQSIHLAILGNGYCLGELYDLAKKLDVVDRIHIFDPVPHNQIYDYLSIVDVAYISAIYCSLYKYGVSPAKMNDYLAAAKPILYGIGDPNNPVEASGCGISCRAEDSDQIAFAMDTLSSMSNKELKLMGARGYKWLMENQTITKQIEAILRKL